MEVPQYPSIGPVSASTEPRSYQIICYPCPGSVRAGPSPDGWGGSGGPIPDRWGGVLGASGQMDGVVLGAPAQMDGLVLRPRRLAGECRQSRGSSGAQRWDLSSRLIDPAIPPLPSSPLPGLSPSRISQAEILYEY